MRITPFTLPIVVAALSLSAQAGAQAAAADALFDSARGAMAKGDFEHACEQFRASDKLDPAPGTELNLADCEEKRGRLASAWELFRTVEEKLGPGDERISVAHGRAEALRPRVPRLTLILTPNSATSSTARDGNVELGAAAFGVALPVDPGAHKIIVSAPGFASRSYELRLAEGESRTVVVSPGASNQTEAVPAFAAGTQAPGHEAPSSSQPSHRRTLGFVLGGSGAVVLSVGAISGALMLSKKSAVDAGCHPDKSCTSAGLDAAHAAHTYQLVSNVSWVVGAAALGVGAYFLLTAGSSAKPSTSVAVASTPSGGQLQLTRSF